MSGRTDDEHLYVRKYNGSNSEITAEDVEYDNSTSGLNSNNVQGAIDELASKSHLSLYVTSESLVFNN